MLRLVDSDEHNATVANLALNASQTEAVAAVAPSEHELPTLPHDHPKWAKDVVAVSQRARALLQRLQPVAIRVLTFWDHRLRACFVGERRVCVDPSGSYRLE